MPNKCRNCGAPIIFAKTINNWTHEISERPIPIDVSPSPGGTLSLFNWPVLFKGTKPGDGSVPERIARRQAGEALAWLQRNGVALYRIHFDTCTRRRY
jgi:hypothetical protein